MYNFTSKYDNIFLAMGLNDTQIIFNIQISSDVIGKK